MGDRRRGRAATWTCSPRTRRSTSATGTPGWSPPRSAQLERVTLVSRAFEHDQFGPFCAELAALAGMDMVLPMNTGAEAVETAIKTARKWGYEVKGVPAGQAVIVAFDGNFHGRTTTIVSFSTDPDARDSYGPYTPGFRVVPYGDPAALAAAMDERVVAVLVEPIQGEAGVVVPPPGLPGRRPGAVHRRTGADDRRRDPVRARPHRDHVRLRARGRRARTCTCSARRSAAASCRSPRWCPPREVLGVFSPASTAPRSAATRWPARSAARSIAMLSTGEFQERSAKLGSAMHDRLSALPRRARAPGARPRPVGRAWSSPTLSAAGRSASGWRPRGVLAKDTHGTTIRPRPAAGHRRGRPGLGASTSLEEAIR